MSSPEVKGNHKTEKGYAILFFFFLTGLTGLVYELVWIRLLTLAFGSTQFAITTVLVTFMSGLALGGLFFGRLVDRVERPLRVYALIEVFLGIYCILSPEVFALLKNIYILNFSSAQVLHAGFEPAQFLLSFAALILPTTLMGGTLPVLVKYLSEGDARIGFNTAVPYSVNTLGAVSGCLVTGFFALYILGVSATLYTAGLIDILVGTLVLFLYRRNPFYNGQKAPYREPDAAPPRARRTVSWTMTVIVLSFALSGFASLAYEVLWSRIFTLIIGSSIYAFTIMLAAFLAGIGIGSILFAPFIDRRRDPLVWFAALEIVIGAAALLSIFLYRELPMIFLYMKELFAQRFWLFLFLEFLLCAAVMIVPTICMGAIFPLVGKIYAEGKQTVGTSIGDIYFFNTAGSIFGAFTAGFFLIPVAGIQNSVILISSLNIIIAVTLFNLSRAPVRSRAFATVVPVFVFVVTSFTLPPWEKTLMTLGLYSNPIDLRTVENIKRGAHPSRLLYYKEGLNAVITVRKDFPYINSVSYQANGKLEALALGTKPPEAWSLLGHIPLLLHGGEPEDALLVGLGSGITLGAMEQYPLKSIDVVELEPAVVKAASFFNKVHNNALKDPRVRLHVTDGRSFLSTTGKSYDVIVSAVSDPWITGVSNLFTHEYFLSLSRRLAPDGIVSLWFQNYRITPRELKTGLNTFASVFPFVSIWFHYTDTLDLIVIGSKKEHRFDMEKLKKMLAHSAAGSDLKRINIRTPYDVLDTFLMGNEDFRAYVKGAPLNTDDRPILEFTLPRYQYMDPKSAIYMVKELLRNVKRVVPPVRINRGGLEDFYYNLAVTFNRSTFRLDQALVLFEKVLEIDPEHRGARQYIMALKKELKRRRGDKEAPL